MSRKYCYAKSAKLGSPSYYSLSGLAKKNRDGVVAILAFYQELSDIIFNYQDASIAQIKFQWWRNEVTKLFYERIDHPVLLFFEEALSDCSKLKEQMLLLIDGMEQFLYLEPFETFEDIVVHLMRTAGCRDLMIAKVLNKDLIVPAELIYQFMLVTELTHYIQHLNLFIKKDILYFSKDELEKFIVTKECLQQKRVTENIKKIIQHQIEKIRGFYTEAFSKIPSNSRMMLQPFLIHSKIALVTLQEIEKSFFSVLENLIQLTPIRLWWIAKKASF